MDPASRTDRSFLPAVPGGIEINLVQVFPYGFHIMFHEISDLRIFSYACCNNGPDLQYFLDFHIKNTTAGMSLCHSDPRNWHRIRPVLV